MRRCASIALIALFLVCAAHAATPSDASLKGVYAFQFSNVQQVGWYKTVSATCFGTLYTMTIGGTASDTEINAGTFTFSGSGTFSFSATKYGQFDQAASNNTPTMTCTGNARQPYTYNSGYPVYFSPSAQSGSGTYHVGSLGNGTITPAGSNTNEVIDISLGQFNAAGVSGIFLMRQSLKNNGEGTMGTAILQ
jgi:hypothetical protein